MGFLDQRPPGRGASIAGAICLAALLAACASAPPALPGPSGTSAASPTLPAPGASLTLEVAAGEPRVIHLDAEGPTFLHLSLEKRGIDAVLELATADGAVIARSRGEAGRWKDEELVAQGRQLFLVGCAFCHGQNGEGVPTVNGNQIGPSLVGVGAAAVDFQVGTGRMPMQASGPQAPAKPVQFTQDEISQLAAYVASLGAGPAIPTAEQVDPELGDAAKGMELFRTNCAMCHGSVGGGGALTQGKFAPSLMETTPTHIYEAMLTGPQSMPVFNNANITEEGKRDIIAYLVAQRDGSPGGLSLGAIGPVAEGFWAWFVGIALLIGSTIWIGARSS